MRSGVRASSLSRWVCGCGQPRRRFHAVRPVPYISGAMPAAPRVKIPSPPESPEALLAWAARHHVSDRLDDLFIGTGPAGTMLPGRPGEAVTYRQALLSAASKRNRNRWVPDYYDVEQ